MSKAVSVVGIISLVPKTDNIKIGYPHYLSVVGFNLLAYERCLLDCVQAGCNQIWIVCNQDEIPLIRYKTGDFVNKHAAWSPRKSGLNKYEKRALVPVYYIVLPSEQTTRKYSYIWSALTAIENIQSVSKKIGTKMQPDRYFVMTPYTIVPRLKKGFLKRNCASAVFYEKGEKLNAVYPPFIVGKDDIPVLASALRAKEIEHSYERRHLAKYLTSPSFTQHMLDVILDGQHEKINLFWSYDITNWTGWFKYHHSGRSLSYYKRKGAVFNCHAEAMPTGRELEEYEKSKEREV